LAKYKKRADGRYAKQVTVGKKNGLPIKKTVYGKTIKEVEEKYREMMLLIDKGIILKNDDLTITELYGEWYRIKKMGKIRENTIKSYQTISKHIKDGIGDNKIKELTMYSVECLVVGLEDEGKKRTALSVLNVINAMMNYAVRNNLVGINPCSEISVEYEPKAKRALTEQEKKNIDINIHKLNPRQQIYLLILRYTGMRKGEVLALSKSDVDLVNGIISINKTLIDSAGKPFVQDFVKTVAGERKVPIFEPLLKPLSDYINTLDGNDLFITSKLKYICLGQSSHWTEQIKRDIGLGDDFTNHMLRHNFISECYSAGVDVKVLQKWVGHADISTTLNIYTHLSDAQIQKSNKMNEFYSSQKEVNPQNNKNEKPEEPTI